jgi:hypothetical protein
MSEGEFFAAITGSDSDLRRAVAALRASGHPFCLIGGLAVNQYTEPVMTLDAEFAVVAATGVEDALRAEGFGVQHFPYSINAQLPGSKLRLRITINSRYAPFPTRAKEGKVFDVPVPVAQLADVVQEKIWAYGDESRRASKRAKDRADLIRLAEDHPSIVAQITPGLIPEIDQMRNQLP